MPGRHSGGSSLGGGGSHGGGFRGAGNLGGGGFRGGGNLGGSGGWGGGPGGGWGWRPRGPWYRPRPLFGWGGGWGWAPWAWFGPRWGYGGGGGCGGVGCVVLLLIFLALICVMSGTGFSLPRYGFGGASDYSVNSSDNSGNTSNNSGATGLAAESPAIQTQTAVDLRELHTAFDSRISQWENQLGSNENQSIPPSDAGLTQDNNTKAVLYGKCGSAFYLYVVDNTKPDTGPADGEGYVYTTASSPGACHPPQWTVYDSEDVGGNWYFATLQSTGQQ